MSISLMFSTLVLHFAVSDALRMSSNQACPDEASMKQIGGRADGYGAWWVCMPLLPTSGITVASIGIGEDTSFDKQIIEKYAATVYGFDPTPKALKYVEAQTGSWKNNFKFAPIGLSDKNGEATLVLPENPRHVSGRIDGACKSCERVQIQVQTLKSLIEHVGKSKVDILKMDVEGTEYKVLNTLMNVDCNDLLFGQLLVEYHQMEEKENKKAMDRHEAMLAQCGFHRINIGGTFAFVK